MYHPSPPHQTYSTCFDVRASICRSHCIYRHICFPNNLNAFSGFNWTGDASRKRSPNLTGECSRVPLLATSHLGWVTPPHANLSLPMINARKHTYTQTNTFIFFLTTPPLTMQEMNLWPLVMLMKAAKQPNRFEVPSLVSESTTGWEKMARV